MPKAPFSALLFALFSAAPTSYAQAPAAPAVRTVTADAPARMKTQPGAESVKVRAVYSPNIRPNPSTIDELAPSESGWRSYGMLLGTLVLMGVIAVRRYKAGRP